MENTLTTTPVNASVKTHQHVMHHIIMILTHATVSVILMTVIQANTLTNSHAVVSVMNISRALTTSTSTDRLASVNAKTSTTVVKDSTTTTTLASAFVGTNQRAIIHTNTTHIHASVYVSHTNVHLISTLTRRPAVAAAMNT